VSLDCTFFVFLVDPISIVHGQLNSAKYRFLGKSRSHSTIHIFKNYFTIVFFAINFQFSVNKGYLNTIKCVWDTLFRFFGLLFVCIYLYINGSITVSRVSHAE